MEHEPKTCERCGKLFLPAYRVTAAYWQGRRFCSPTCTRAGMKGERRSTFRRVKVSLEDRFWNKVNKGDPGECWMWAGAVMHGYGYLAGTRGEKAVKVHRLSYTMNVGQIPDGLCVCHRCDVPLCVNPAHLFIGTRADNNADKESKGRGGRLKGAEHPKSKLSVAMVRKIIRMRSKKMSQQSIADKIGVSQNTVSRVLLNRTWVVGVERK